MTLRIVGRTEEEFQQWLMTEPGFVAALMAYDDEPVVLEAYQREFSPTARRFRWVNKSRQVGFVPSRSRRSPAATRARSTRRSSPATTYGTTRRRRCSPPPASTRSCRSRTRSGSSWTRRRSCVRVERRDQAVSRILSHPSKAPRGKKGDVYLDELAHYVNDREVYRGSTALILRSNGQLTGCTPLGRAASSGRSPTRSCASTRTTPGSTCRGGCAASSPPTWAASQLARPAHGGARRALRAAHAHREQLDSLPIEDFQQEFEGKLSTRRTASSPTS